jgi:hypothetical protein
MILRFESEYDGAMCTNFVLYDDLDRIVNDLDDPTPGERMALACLVETWNALMPQLCPWLEVAGACAT